MISGPILSHVFIEDHAVVESPLQIAVLNLFVQLQSRFRNMVAGVITRDSVRNALLKGITADQVR